MHGCGLAGLGALAAAAASPSARAGDRPAKLSAEQLADRIDQLIEAKWREKEIRPSPVADDGEFFRRLSLDVGGRIPGVMDARLFFDDKSADKRRKAVDKLLDSPLYANHFAAVWRALMVPDNNNPFAQNSGQQLEAWLKARLRENTPYDKMVREMITAPVVGNRPRHDGPRRRRADAAGVLPGQGDEAGEPGRGHGAAVPRREDRVRPVPQPPVRQVEARAVLGVRRLLRRHPDAARRQGVFGAVRRRRPTAARSSIPGTEQGRPGPLPRRHRAEVEVRRPARARPWPTG